MGGISNCDEVLYTFRTRCPASEYRKKDEICSICISIVTANKKRYSNIVDL